MTRSRLVALGLTTTLALAAAASPGLAKMAKPRPSVTDISFTHHDKPSPVLLGLAPSSSQSRGRYQLRLSEARGV